MTQRSEDQISEIEATVKEIKKVIVGNPEYRIDGLVDKFDSMSSKLDGFNSRLSHLEENEKRQKWFAAGAGAVMSAVIWIIKFFIP